MDKVEPTQKDYVRVWLGLLVLLATTCGVAFIPLGKFNIVVSMAVSVAKTFLIMSFFMHLWYQKGLIRIVAFIGFAWLSILIGFTLTEYLTRTAYFLR